MATSCTAINVPTTAQGFRDVCPAFADEATFPDESIMFWLSAACLLLTHRWGNMRGLATILFVEHNLALEAFSANTAAAGGIPGIGLGMVASQAAKAVSISYDTAMAGEEGAGVWNLTTYGQRLYRLMMMFGAGPVQINTGGWGGGFFNFEGWNGLPFGPGWWTH
jgi:hypothetical protein